MKPPIFVLAIAAAAACGDDVAPVPTCAELGCGEVALCNRSGECTCTPPDLDEPVACTAGWSL
jgi:hypothetical protein